MNEDYSEARRIGIKERRKAVLGRKAGYLCSLDKKVKNLLSLPVVDVGRHEIPLSMVVGTRNEDRRKSFSAGFMPLMDEDSEFASKWQNLYQAQLEEGIRDPIRVFEYRRQFYVEEGNKRVSVLKYLKTPSVMADISRIMPERTNDPETRAYYEFLDYYRVAPIYEIGFSLPGEYEKLAELVGENLVKKWPAEKVKQDLATAIPLEEPRSILVRGINQLNNSAGTVHFSSTQAYEAVKEPCEAILKAIRLVLERTPPELCADIMRGGIHLTGGGSMLFALDQYISEKLDIPVLLARDPADCCILGIGYLAENIQLVTPQN